MTKRFLALGMSACFAFPALAQVADPGDARVVLLGPDGIAVTDRAAVSTPEAVQDMRSKGQTGEIAPVMRDTDRLVLEPLVNRIGIDSGSLVETTPVTVKQGPAK